MLCDHKVTWGKAFSWFSAVFGVFDRIIYTECTDVTSPFFHSQACRRIQINRQSIILSDVCGWDVSRIALAVV